jgi:hypothetical protein
MTAPKLNQPILSIPMPDRTKCLPISATGFPVPWFAHGQDGKPDFRVTGPDQMTMAVKRSLCWICGQPLGVHKAFLIGPMCAVNRCISEPPSHLECARYPARACPFLTTPNAKRNAKDLPEERVTSAGAIMRNPGAVAVWITKTLTASRHDGSVLFRLSEPERVRWFVEWRPATRAKVDRSIETGLPFLIAEAKRQGVDPADTLQEFARVQHLLPA